MRNSEEFKVLGVITLTLVLLLAFCLSTSDVLALLLLAFIGLGVALAYSVYAKKERIGPADERSGRVSLAASRNGFLAIALLLAFDAIASRLYPSLTTAGEAAIIAWGLGVFVYLATYVVGVRNP